MIDSKNQHISEILTVVVKYNRLVEYEQWLEKAKKVLEQQKGFVGIEVIRPADITIPEYFILLRFESLTDLEAWKDSDALDELKKESQEFVVNVHRGERQYGTEMLFSRPISNIYYPKPPFWKQAIIGIFTVYPIIMLSSLILSPLFKDLPQALGMFITICIMSPIMIVTMPKVSVLFKKWLYPIS